MQAPGDLQEDSSGGFQYGGWAKDYWVDTMEQVGREAMTEPYDLLLGRNTYNSFASNFAGVISEDPVAEMLNQSRKYVVTSSSDDLKWHNSIKIDTKDVVAEIHKLKKTDGPLLQVHGSWQLVQLLISNQLIDEYRLWTFPVSVGRGKRLFADGVVPSKFKLIKCETVPSGVFMHVYEPIGDVSNHQ